ncbi:MAG: hypothetical protein PHS37_04905 [Candidatus Omnitrophica bacterium]|nr:hypothetical protein [Candidatus Omnitrophota bacterium]
MMFRQSRAGMRGISLAELLLVAGITSFLFVAIIGIWVFTYKNWTIERVHYRLHVNLEVAMETIRQEIRLSSTTYMSGYPIGGTSFTAISFPLASQDADGFYTLSGGAISWDQSVIYHTYKNPVTGNNELRRTVFTDNSSVLIDKTQRDAQLTSVVTNGDGTAALNSAHATTKVVVPRTPNERLIQNAALILAPAIQEFNCYNATEQRVNVSFGCIELTSGYHDLTFTVTGKQADSSGYEFGIDTLSVTPCGVKREAEVINDYDDILDTIKDSSGDGTTKLGPDSLWSGQNCLEYDANAVTDYLTFNVYYDLWRESNFDGATLDNVTLDGDDLHAKLKDVSEGKTIAWQAAVEASGPLGTSVQTDYPGTVPMRNKTIRVTLSQSNVVASGDMVRVKFYSHSTGKLTISKAYLDIKDDAAGDTPKLKYDPSDLTQLALYQTYHSQLFFRTVATGEIAQSVTIDPNNPQDPSEPNAFYSDWVIYPLDPANSYFVTFHIADNSGEDYISYWPGTSGKVSYLIDEESYATQVDWTGYSQSPDVYVAGFLEAWHTTGSVISGVFDTKVTSPEFNTLRWNDSKPAHTTISVKSRSSDNADMSGASAWGSIAGSGSNPHGLSIGDGEYAQFKADLALNLYWTCSTHPSVNVADTDYKHSGVMACTEGGCSRFLIPSASIATGNYCPWIDNVTIDWPGSDKICEISGYLRQAPNYGIISLSVDGVPLTKTIRVGVQVQETLQGKTYDAQLTQDMVLRNTGK